MNQINHCTQQQSWRESHSSKVPYLRKVWILVVGIILFSAFHREVWASPFAQVVTHIHSCGGAGGVIEFEILGNPDEFTWYWTHGPTDLRLEDLPVGTYTFVVKDFFGCVETYDINIENRDHCEFRLGYHAPTECSFQIGITVLLSGQIVDPSELIIIWSDGVTGELIRTVSRDCEESFNLCVDISFINPAQLCCQTSSCCTYSECIFVKSDPTCCDQHERTVIVNEFNRTSEGTAQFVELLVAGNGECEQTFDLRGYHVDDNNGFLIPGNEAIHFFNKDQIGINDGFISFQPIDAWQAIPNGSLIVIYSDETPPSNIPADDPEDANQDGVYVLAASNLNYLMGNEGTWDETANLQYYQGAIALPTWDFIAISENADGMQVSNPEGLHVHGISLGETVFALDNTYPIWFSNKDATACNCRLVGTNYLDKAHFLCDAAINDSQTPGLPNSTDNATLISSLLDCDGLLGAPDRESEDIKIASNVLENELKVYPNPFEEELIFDFNSLVDGEARIQLYSVTGQEILHESWHSESGNNTFNLKINPHIPSGILLLQFTFPSGEKWNKRLVRMDAR